MSGNEPKKAVLYARYSPGKDKEDSDSSTRQLDECRDKADKMGWPIEAEFHDDMTSGSSRAGRPGFEAALELVCKVKGVLVVWELSRVTRSIADDVEIVAKLVRAGADIHSITEPMISTSSETGEFFMHLMALLNQMERKRIARRTSEAMIWKQSQGVRVTPPSMVPFGKQVDPNDPARIIDYPFESDALHLAQDMLSEGLSYRKVAKELKLAGYCNRKGNPLSAQYIHKFVRDNC